MEPIAGIGERLIPIPTPSRIIIGSISLYFVWCGVPLLLIKTALAARALEALRRGIQANPPPRSDVLAAHTAPTCAGLCARRGAHLAMALRGRTRNSSRACSARQRHVTFRRSVCQSLAHRHKRLGQKRTELSGAGAVVLKQRSVPAGSRDQKSGYRRQAGKKRQAEVRAQAA